MSDQPKVVQDSIGEFMKSLAEAVIIVLAVSFIALGMRVGLVVALSIPLVLAMTFLAMYMLDIDLQRVSLGALIIALGLLVDDAIIAVEMMALKLEQGWDRVPRRDLRLHRHRVPDADRHADHCGGLPAGRHGEDERRRVHVLDLPGRGHLADPVVDRRGAVHAVHRLTSCCRTTWPARPWRTTKTPSISVRSTRASAASSTGASCIAAASSAAPSALFVALDRAVQARAAAVLPRVGPSRADGRPVAAAGRVVRRDRARSEGAGSGAGRQRRHRVRHVRTSASAARASTCRSTSRRRTSTSASSWS